MAFNVCVIEGISHTEHDFNNAINAYAVHTYLNVYLKILKKIFSAYSVLITQRCFQLYMHSLTNFCSNNRHHWLNSRHGLNLSYTKKI